MSYDIQLGYPKGRVNKRFELAMVKPFGPGGTFRVDLKSARMAAELASGGDVAVRAEDIGNSTALRALLESHSLNLQDFQPVNDEGLMPAELNVTFNYTRRISDILGEDGGFRVFDGKTGVDAIGGLATLYSALGDEEADSYWEPTDGNIKKATSTLVSWCVQHPRATFRSIG